MKNYTSVSANVSKEDNLYRVRFQKKGKRYSKYFTNKKAAMQYRKQKLGY
jgi:hypothetical protein